LWENHEPIKQNQTEHDKKYTVLLSLQKSNNKYETKNEIEQENRGENMRTHTNRMGSESSVENGGVIVTVEGSVHARLRGLILILLYTKE